MHLSEIPSAKSKASDDTAYFGRLVSDRPTHSGMGKVRPILHYVNQG